MGNNIYTDDEMNLFLVLRLKSCLKQLPQVEHVEGGGGVGWGKWSGGQTRHKCPESWKLCLSMPQLLLKMDTYVMEDAKY